MNLVKQRLERNEFISNETTVLQHCVITSLPQIFVNLILKIIVEIKSFNTTFNMGTLLTNAYTRLDQKSKPLETNSVAIGTKELLLRKIHFRKHFSFFYKMAF